MAVTHAVECIIAVAVSPFCRNPQTAKGWWIISSRNRPCPTAKFPGPLEGFARIPTAAPSGCNPSKKTLPVLDSGHRRLTFASSAGGELREPLESETGGVKCGAVLSLAVFPKGLV